MNGTRQGIKILMRLHQREGVGRLCKVNACARSIPVQVNALEPEISSAGMLAWA